MGDRLTVIIHLPIEVRDFNRLLTTLADIDPDVLVNTNGEDGWLIEIGPDDG
jgi:hypothetical protein